MNRSIRRFPAVAALAARVALVALAAASPTAQAGQNCEARPLRTESAAQALELASRVGDALDATGARVVLLARAGRNLDEWGLRWSHLGLAYRDDAAGGWQVVHKLNACGTATGDLFRQGLGPFFLDDVYRHEAGVLVPTPALQAALLPLLRDDSRVTQLQHRAYNMVAHPWSTRYQQSNQWVLETLALAAEPAIADRSGAQAWLRFKGYRPTVLRIGPVQRLGARVGTAHIAFDDHPDADRYSDRIATVTVESVFAFLAGSGLGTPPQVLR
ncbi:DUF2145 domain-containing protein [Leptothrix discophora]|uniref:DUF2145 domain-containing protein n=1 Tax=Leptothrix discophora TaxID=89 RepID=A0ABT9G0G9_LEPDI|nr:DUF2145 domain-containing protein [Leptothrix discophora]MDP4299961.1 DUF2145 domain-containing protein [Leptothrix discophora]